MQSYVKLILHSVAPTGIDVATFEMTYPLVMHNELLTHRKQGKSDSRQYDEWLESSRSSSSNRALGTDRVLAAVANEPYIPRYQYTQRGMVAGEFVTPEEQQALATSWLRARDACIAEFKVHQQIRAHKQWANRLLSTWQYITVVATANGEYWEHFFKLRDHQAAMPDFREIAHMTHELYRASEPVDVLPGHWHLPYITWEDWQIGNIDTQQAKAISVARCARTSYLRQGEMHRVRDDVQLYNDLRTATPPHAAPFEHVLRSSSDAELRSGNVIGWDQLRKLEGL